MFCPYPKCCRVPVYDDAKNKRWHDRSEAWAKSNAIVDIYEYYGNAMGSARPGSDMAQKDLVYWSKLGFSGKMYAEQPADVRWKEPADDPAGQWDFGLMENWVMTRLFVDPARDVEKLRDEFCRRAYHEGAPMMRKFFATIRSEWFADSNYQGWEEEATYSLARYVRAKGKVEEMRGLLVKASDGVIENNTLEGVEGWAVLMAPECTWTYTGHEFVAWTNLVDGGVAIAAGAALPTEVEDSYTLTAVWAEKSTPGVAPGGEPVNVVAEDEADAISKVPQIEVDPPAGADVSKTDYNAYFEKKAAKLDNGTFNVYLDLKPEIVQAAKETEALAGKSRR